MPNEQDKNPTTATESDISKAQSQQQPPNQASQQQRESGERSGQFETGQQGQREFAQDRQAGAADEGLQGDTLAQQRTDVEGASRQSPETGEAESGFVGAEGQEDTSSELIDEEDEDFGKDGQGAPEGK